MKFEEELYANRVCLRISQKVREGQKGQSSNLVVLRALIKKRFVQIPELGLTEGQVTVFFPPDHLTEGIGEDVTIFVKGLFDKPERTGEIRQQLAGDLANCCENFLRQYMDSDLLVEYILDPPFLPGTGFASVTTHALSDADCEGPRTEY